MGILPWYLLDNLGSVAFFPPPPQSSGFQGIPINAVGDTGRASIELAIRNLESTNTFHNLMYAVREQGYSRIYISYTTAAVGTGGHFNESVHADGSKSIGVYLDPLNRIIINNREMSVEEIIFHEVAHAIAKPENYWDYEQAAVSYTNGFRQEVGLDYRGDYHSGRFLPGVGLHPNLENVNRCFLAGTMIEMWPEDDGAAWQKPIEEIAPGDKVVSFDENGKRVAGKVTRAFQNHSRHILDLHGLMITPGHATWCAEGAFEGRYVPIIDILRSDGAIQREDGTLIRAATGYVVGSREDRLIPAVTVSRQENGEARIAACGQVRLGTAFLMSDGRTVTVGEFIRRAGLDLHDDGRLSKLPDIPVHDFVWTWGEQLPSRRIMSCSAAR